ncbi:cysteine dioxygenase family protein [uncultured Psychroserpens sp.]|uniref:cysteine dioxygenase n=1 Tax=uncultured Psychroserpens sp. TaxID=255436 RepID=UPI0026239FBC|nr:cysteine dioxygenase family protein [uncultured Psychroserpens sp.]
MKSPKHIQDLIDVLSKSSKEDYSILLRSFGLDGIDFQPVESWSSEKYTRNCIYRDDVFELILLCWEAGQETPIHGHDGEDCWVYMMKGELQEVYYTIDTQNYLREERSQRLAPKQISFMNDKIGFHKLKNVNQGRSISLHLYAKPIEHCRSFDDTSGRFIKTKLNYDTYQQVVCKD